jgi:hypothetical protein
MINGTSPARPPMLHVAIDTPNGRWLQADFGSAEEMWSWVARRFEELREQYGQHEWFKIRVEDWSR